MADHARDASKNPEANAQGVLYDERTDLDPLFDCLGNRRRRAVAIYVRERGSVSLDELVRRLDDVASPRSDDGEGDRERLRIELHHKHLPLLDRAGIVEYDAENHVVSDTDRSGRAETVLDRFEGLAGGT